MIDFLTISTRSTRSGVLEIYPKFIIKRSSDLMIRGGDFYAIWVEERGLWSTDEQDAIYLIDRELDRYAEENRHKFGTGVKILHMWDAESGMIDNWHKYCQRQLRDNYNSLDENLIFSNTVTTKKDYATKKLSYPLEPGHHPAYDSLMSTLYSEEERHKIEWAIGAIVSGGAKKLQKFMVLYGSAGTGKSTILNIIQHLFEGYYSVFDAKALGSSSNSFALEAFKSNPLVAIQHDGDLSKIEDNTRLNSLVSHELMTVNEKFKATYANRFNCFLFMGTNKPVKITDARSGLIRRLIDVTPTGEKLNSREYKQAIKQVEFELGAIACTCNDIYIDDPSYYDDYIPISMMGASNDFYNFVDDSYQIFKNDDGVTLKSAWEMYKAYCDEAKVAYPYPKRAFSEELKSYFKEYKDRHTLDDGTRVRSYFYIFRTEKFGSDVVESPTVIATSDLIPLNATTSIFDIERADCVAQYATDSGTPTSKWDNTKTTLKDLDTRIVHYVKVPDNHIVIDFDITDSSGNKSLELNLKEASKWPKTYTELSKSGKGVHLHYIYTGDVTKLSRVYDHHIEVKVFTGNSSLRRCLTKCNDIPIASISSGLPLKGDTKLINFEAVKSEKALRTLIKRNLNKEIHAGTKPSVDFIAKILSDAYESGLKYDVTDMRNAILTFAANSTNQSDISIKMVNNMHFKSEDISDNIDSSDDRLVFYDVEVFPNLFICNWKFEGENNPVIRMINPSSAEIEQLLKYKLIGFNCRRYDNHILYARLMGYDNEQLYTLSQRIISGSRNAFFGEAYNISYTDIYDFSSIKQSLKQFEIDLGFNHMELGLPWDQPVPEELWVKVAEYCDNDVLATEAVFNDRKSDFLARRILAKMAKSHVNEKTNTLTTKIIFGSNRTPQSQFNYRFMGTKADIVEREFDLDVDPEFTKFDKNGRPIFPDYTFNYGKSIYRGEEVGEGGYVYTEPGIHTNVALLDIASMHPTSVIVEELFGKEFTQRFKDIVDARIFVKHKEYDKARTMLSGELSEFLDDPESVGDLATALKIAINSVYGLTMTSYENAFRDTRNIDNIVAKRGALFMINLKHEVQKRGFTVAHIKTDSIKIPNATPEIIEFVSEYGTLYGYSFEHEATYEKMCLVNKSVYIAKYQDGDWSATGTQFQIPYVFKKLFSKEEIIFDDLCTTNAVKSAMYLDHNEQLEDVQAIEDELIFRSIILKRGNSDNKRKKSHIHLADIPSEELVSMLQKGHDYRFIGKVGRFTPIKPNMGGSVLVREADIINTGDISIPKYAAVTGSKGYRWAEASVIEASGEFDRIDRSYFDRLVDDAIETINEYGDAEWFCAT